VAIKKDKEASIFNVAHFGIVADYKEVLPAPIAKLKELPSLFEVLVIGQRTVYSINN